jgi:hypothetical protein
MACLLYWLRICNGLEVKSAPGCGFSDGGIHNGKDRGKKD